jgi:hypothetical protein
MTQMELITIGTVVGEEVVHSPMTSSHPGLSEQVTKDRNCVTVMGYHERSKFRTSWLAVIETFLYSELLTSVIK